MMENRDTSEAVEGGVWWIGKLKWKRHEIRTVGHE